MHTPTRTVAALVAAITVVPAAALAATPKNTGAYYSKPVKGQSITIGVASAKVYNVSATLRFKKNGKVCAAGRQADDTTRSVYVTLKKPVKPKSDGSFALTRKSGDTTFPATFTLKGRFVTSTKAKLKISAKYKGCKATFSTSKAKYTTGG